MQYPAGRTGDYSIPAGVTSISAYTFSSCAGLTGVSIPASVTSIDDGVFVGCARLQSYHVASGNPQYASPGGLLIDATVGKLIRYPQGRTGFCYLPDSVSRIAGVAFLDCTGLTGVLLSNGVSEIGGSAFRGPSRSNRFHCLPLADICSVCCC